MANLLITAGPTREPIDRVRFIGNRSSGRMGVAIAQAAADAGHDVTLLLGPAPDPESPETLRTRMKLFHFETTAELDELLHEFAAWYDVLIMAAAVADYRPVARAGAKLERLEKGQTLTLELEPTEDLVAHAASHKRGDQRIIAFALEEAAKLEARASEKLRRKRVDAIVANPLETMDAADVDAVLLWSDGRREPAGRMSKAAFAAWLVGKVAERREPQ